MLATGLQPIATLCIERLLLSSELYYAPADSPRLQQFRDGVAFLNRIEHTDVREMPGALKGAAEFLDEPIIAIELDAVIDHFLKKLPPNSLKFEILTRVGQTARKRIFRTWTTHQQNHNSSPWNTSGSGLPLTAASQIEEVANSILNDLVDMSRAGMEESIRGRLANLGEAQGLEGLAKSLFFLEAILCVHHSTKQNLIWLEQNQANPRGMRKYPFSAEGAAEDHRRCDRLIRATQYGLTRVYLSLYKIAASDHADSAGAIGWLRYASGSDARSILHEIESVRDGRSPFAIWLGRALRTNYADTVSRSHILALARAMEIEHEVVDGRPFPHESTSEVLWNSSECCPLPGGQTFERQRGPIQEETMRLLAALQANPHADSVEAMHAINAAATLVGDPRVDAQSLLDWVQSLYGERRSFSEEQFVRFLEEANAFVPTIMRMNSNRKMVISREHRKDLNETLASSFDAAIVDTTNNTVVEVIEIKQTSRPRRASDIGGILRQATSKLDGEVSALAEPSAPLFQFRISPDKPSQLRHIDARRTLIIQFPWELNAIQYKVGALLLVVHHHGGIERWRSKNGEEKGVLVGQENLFLDIARHLPRVTDADYFDEIVLSDVFGRFLVSYTHGAEPGFRMEPSAACEGGWHIHSYVGGLSSGSSK